MIFFLIHRTFFVILCSKRSFENVGNFSMDNSKELNQNFQKNFSLEIRFLRRKYTRHQNRGSIKNSLSFVKDPCSFPLCTGGNNFTKINFLKKKSVKVRIPNNLSVIAVPLSKMPYGFNFSSRKEHFT